MKKKFVALLSVLLAFGSLGTLASCDESSAAPVAPETVVTLKSISTSGLFRRNYKEGESFESAALSVFATYTDDSYKQVYNYTLTPNRALVVTDTRIQVSYTEGSITKTTDILIAVTKEIAPVVTLTSISVSGDFKTSYTEGDKFDSTGIIVTANYSDDSSKRVYNYSLSPTGILTTSDDHIVISYTEGGVTKTENVPITVSKKASEYTLKDSSKSLVMGEEYKIQVLKGGVEYSGATFKSENELIAKVDKDGYVSPFQPGNIDITVTINSETSLIFKLTVTEPKTEIYRFMLNNMSGYNIDDDNLVILYYIKSYTNMEAISSFEFQFDTFNNIVMIISKCDDKASSANCVTYGYNVFEWGDYKNGLFVGNYYPNEFPGRYYSVQFLNLVFASDGINYDDNTQYTERHNDFVSDVSFMIMPMFYRVQECCDFANIDFFKAKGSSLRLY